MKLLMLGWELPPHNSGGLGVACYQLSKALAQNGAEIEFMLPYEATHKNTEFMKIVSATKRSPLEKFGAYEHDITPGDDIRAVQKEYVEFVREYVKESAPQIIHAHDWLTMEAGMMAKKISGAQLVVHVHATEFDRSGARAGNPLIHEIEAEGLLMADRIIAVSALTKALIVQNYHIPADKIDVVHNAFDPNEFLVYDSDAITYRYLETLRDEGVTIVSSLGRLTVQKGLFQLLHGFSKAVSKYPKMALLIAGDGEQRNELIELAAELRIAEHVFFAGFVRGQAWRDAYAISDIFVMSSISEPFGLTALEAAHHGAALILTKQSGASEILHSALKYDFWDTDKLANELVGIAASSALADDLRDGARAEYARLSWHDVAQKCLELYAKLPQKGVFE